MLKSHRVALISVFVASLATFGLAACGSDDASTASTSPAVPTAPNTNPPPTNPPVTNPPVTNPPATDGGGGMQAGAPSFESFDVSSSVPCEGGNATVTMSYSTLNAVTMSIKIGSGNFEETAGYGPTEQSVVASIPCSGAGTSSVQMRGCTEDGQCADSPKRDVTITG